MKTARNRLRAAVVAAALLALTACSNTGPGTAAADPAPSTSSSPGKGTPKVEGDPKTGKVDYCKDQNTPFTGEAAEKFGAEKVMTAYCDMVALTMEQSFVPSLMRKDKGFRAVEFSVPRDLMTSDAAADWDTSVAKIVNGDTSDYSNPVIALMLYNVTFGGPYDFYPAGEQPAVLNLQFTPADTWVDHGTAETRLGMEFKIKGNFLTAYAKDNKPYVLPFEKTFTVALVEDGTNPDKPWLIDGWDGSSKFGQYTKWTPGTVS